jgi:hypothetical protein
VIFAWDGVGQAGVRAANIAAQKDYATALGERLVGYGHIVSDDASLTLATTVVAHKYLYNYDRAW